MTLRSDPQQGTWDRVWQQYETLEEPTTPRLVETLLAVEPRGKWVLEVGCGTGKDSFRLAEVGARVISLDFSLEALRLVRRKAAESPGPAPWLAGGDTLRLPFRDETFDVVFHQGLLEHFTDPRSVLLEQVRVLRPGGYLLVDVPQRLNWYAVTKRRRIAKGTWFAGWESDFTLPQLNALLRGVGLRPVRCYAYGYNPPAFWVLRNLHRVGEGRRGRPYLPRAVGRLWDRVWTRWENSALAGYALVCIGVLARKSAAPGRSGG